MKPHELLQRGSRLTPDEVAELQRRVATQPDDLDARILLIGASKGERRYAHVLSLIHLRPDIWFVGASVIPAASSSHERARAAWRAAIESDPTNAVVLLNAARFLRQEDAVSAESLLSHFADGSPPMRRAVATYYDEALVIASAQNGRGQDPSKLAGQVLRAHFDIFMVEGLSVSDRVAQIWPMRQAAGLAGQSETVRLLRVADRVSTTVAGAPDASHPAHTAFGLVFLALGEASRARAEMAAAATNVITTTEVRLDLARELFALERDAVVAYLRACVRQTGRSRERIESILAAIDRGSSPVWDTPLTGKP